MNHQTLEDYATLNTESDSMHYNPTKSLIVLRGDLQTVSIWHNEDGLFLVLLLMLIADIVNCVSKPFLTALSSLCDIVSVLSAAM